MGVVSESEQSILRPHIPDGETLIDAFTGEKRTVAVTDRRVLEVAHAKATRTQETDIKSTYLTTDYIVGTQYYNGQETKPPMLEYIIGGLLILIGLIFMAIGIGDGNAGFLLAFLLFVALGGLIIYAGEKDESGEVKITIERAEDLADMSWTFPRGETEVPRAISEQVARINGDA